MGFIASCVFCCGVRAHGGVGGHEIKEMKGGIKMNHEEDSCENCWWHYGINGGSCCHPVHARLSEDEDETPCGYFEPKLSSKSRHERKVEAYESYQNEWN